MMLNAKLSLNERTFTYWTNLRRDSVNIAESYIIKEPPLDLKATGDRFDASVK